MKHVTGKAINPLALGLAIIAAVSGCSTPRDTYNVLMAKSSQATTLQDAIWDSRPSAIFLGLETPLHLKDRDHVLFVDGFLSYYRVFWLDVAAGQKYTLTLISWPEANSRKVLIPAVYVVDSEGRVLTQTPRYLRTKGGGAINGLAGDGPGLVGEWNFSAEKKDRYHLVIAADNSRPGEVNDVGYANATGHMVFKVDQH